MCVTKQKNNGTMFNTFDNIFLKNNDDNDGDDDDDDDDVTPAAAE